jgi:hypothetical protein
MLTFLLVVAFGVGLLFIVAAYLNIEKALAEQADTIPVADAKGFAAGDRIKIAGEKRNILSDL